MPDPPVFDQLNLVARDMDATLAFYRRLGLEIPGTAPEWAQHHRNAKTNEGIDLDFDSQTFARQWDAGWKSGPVIGFRVSSRDEVDRLHDDLVAAGYSSQQAPYDAFWGARYAVIEDPDGNSVGLMSPIDDARRSNRPPP
jgi:catechol 2,3-dioxygenase-like lactoylglutathione lyase family enzyme